MKTFLFAWNPNKWDWQDQQDLITQLPHQQPIRAWATVSTKNIQIGDRFILIKIGNIPKTEKGIIGIGTIVSLPYTDKDFLKDDKIRHFVKLKFEHLSTQTFISLRQLEKTYPHQNWTIQGSGILIKEPRISTEIFDQIHQQYTSKSSQKLFAKSLYFPIVANEIDLKLNQQTSVHRDEIVEILLTKYSQTIEKISKNSNKTSLFIAQNMMDWFSAELTKKSELVAKWQNKYHRNKVKINGREITNFSLVQSFAQQDEFIPDNIQYKEGTLKQITVNAYERNPLARKKCLEIFGYACQCCSFNFETRYGEIGKNFIHVHHLTPLSQIQDEYTLNPETDLKPVCANCHAMLHRKNPPYTIEEIRALMKI